VFKAHYIDPK